MNHLLQNSACLQGHTAATFLQTPQLALWPPIVSNDILSGTQSLYSTIPASSFGQTVHRSPFVHDLSTRPQTSFPSDVISGSAVPDRLNRSNLSWREKFDNVSVPSSLFCPLSVPTSDSNALVNTSPFGHLSCSRPEPQPAQPSWAWSINSTPALATPLAATCSSPDNGWDPSNQIWPPSARSITSPESGSTLSLSSSSWSSWPSASTSWTRAVSSASASSRWSSPIYSTCSDWTSAQSLPCWHNDTSLNTGLTWTAPNNIPGLSPAQASEPDQPVVSSLDRLHATICTDTDINSSHGKAPRSELTWYFDQGVPIFLPDSCPDSITSATSPSPPPSTAFLPLSSEDLWPPVRNEPVYDEAMNPCQPGLAWDFDERDQPRAHLQSTDETAQDGADVHRQSSFAFQLARGIGVGITDLTTGHRLESLTDPALALDNPGSSKVKGFLKESEREEPRGMSLERDLTALTHASCLESTRPFFNSFKANREAIILCDQHGNELSSA